MQEESPIVMEVRERAQRISERFGHDARKYLEHLKELQSEERHLVVSQITVTRPAEKIRE